MSSEPRVVVEHRDSGCFGCAVLILLVIIACSVTGCCRDQPHPPPATISP